MLAQTLGAAVQPDAAPTGGGGGAASPGAEGPVTTFISAVSSSGSPGVPQSAPRPNAGAGPVIGVSSAGWFVAGQHDADHADGSSPVTSLFVSANSTIGSTSLGPQAVTDSYYLISLPRRRRRSRCRFALPSTRRAASRSSSAARPRAVRPVTSPSCPCTRSAATCTYALAQRDDQFRRRRRTGQRQRLLADRTAAGPCRAARASSVA